MSSRPAAAGSIAFALALTGCGGSGHAGTASVTSTRTITQTEQVSAAPSPKTPPGVPYCASKDLGIHFVLSQGATGRVISEFQFVNVTKHSCRLEGYPGASALGRNGATLPLDMHRNPAFPPHRVLLAPGGRAGFLFQTFDQVGGGPCQTSSVLRFIPPNDSQYEQIAHRQLICRKLAYVTVVGSR